MEENIPYYVQRAMELVLMLSMPPILVAIAAGLGISLIMAMTQLQEQTLSFGVKLVAVTVALIGTALWMGGELVKFTNLVFEAFPYLSR